mgnify:CR=1 FL=1|tara:strand:- start:684 stop:1361 length:678 start_codon:yes stop_codon:yes gene_type:complete
MNYTELSNAIQAYTENTETNFVAEIPVFVQQAEQRIYNSVQFPSIRKNVYGQVTANNKYLQCPLDFLAVYSLAIVTGVTNNDMNTGTYEYLLNKDVNFIRQAYPTPNDTGVPKHYALFGPRSDNAAELTFIVGPTPDSAYFTELHYYFYPESIVTAGTTWLGDNFDSVLLYGALVEAYTYMKGEQDMMQLYNQKFMEALALAKRLGDGMERQDAYRSGQFRQKVT